MPVTRFPSRASGVAERMSGFMAHLRLNGMNVGIPESEAALLALPEVNISDWRETRLALKVICANDADRFHRFDDLFNAYWFNDGREKERDENSRVSQPLKHRRSNRSLVEDHISVNSSGSLAAPDSGSGNTDAEEGEGRLVASATGTFEKKDMREFVQPDDIKRAEKVAEQIARAIRDRRSRRRKAAKRGSVLDLRRIARKSISRGGEPIELLKKKRPDRPPHLVALLDVSGSMTIYAQVFLAFLKGLVSVDQKTDAYLFHTRLVKISDALRDRDTFRALNRLTMMADGFGSGTKIASNLQAFNQHYASQSVTGRSVVLILSDGYDTDPSEALAMALLRLKKRGCRIIWLNPLLGWKGYEPVARGMASALPHIDFFAAANTLDSLAALEPHLGRM